MTPEQHYLFDINGYLHLPNVLSDSKLAAVRAAIDRYMAMSDDGKFYVKEDVGRLT